MKNFRVFAPLVSGEQMELHDCDTGQQVIAQLFSHDWGAPPRSIVIEAIAKDTDMFASRIWSPRRTEPHGVSNAVGGAGDEWRRNTAPA